mmetsp:Transcript_26729/g.43865  ORF Transcript_26729/g.43865 Transcript_26729/m.43865 type:complete len:356 (+) Transcript_26729:86-1153(+)
MSCNLSSSSAILYLSLVCLFIGPKEVVSSSPSKSFFVSSPNFITKPSSSLSKRRLYNEHHHQLNAHATTSQQEQQHPSGRRWKNRRKRQTFLPSPVRNVSPCEEDALMDQLGYVPSNVCAVSARSGDDRQDITNNNDSTIDTSSKGVGRPIAIRSYPLLVQQLANTNTNENNGQGNNNDSHDNCNVTPFPTLYWLTCPHVSRAISDLERQGYVRNFQSKLENNKDLAAEWWDCHEGYASERWNILSMRDREWLLQKDGKDETEERKRESMKEIIQYSGVAGTDHRGLRENIVSGNDSTTFVPSVKCLHSHYAHYRSQLSKSTAGADADGGGKIMFNLVGQWTHELLLDQFPEILL